jgi:hypothetical protein
MIRVQHETTNNHAEGAFTARVLLLPTKRASDIGALNVLPLLTYYTKMGQQF